MSSQLNVFVSSPVLLDLDIYALWVQGYTVAGAVSAQVVALKGEYGWEEREYLVSEVHDQFRNFDVILHFLKYPAHFSAQCLCQLSPAVQQRLLEEYYAFDDVVMREFLGKKMTSRQRKDLDDVCTKTGLTLFNVRRQFDNLKRIHKIIEDLPGSLAGNIITHFLLSPVMAERYARIVFINRNRLETTKKKLAYLSLTDLQGCAGALMAQCTKGQGEKIDHSFLLEMRDLRSFVMGEKGLLDNYRLQVKTYFQTQRVDEAHLLLVQKSFKNVIKVVLTLGCYLNQGKEVRHFFLDLVERLVLPLKAANWLKKDVATMMAAAIHAFPLVVLEPSKKQRFVGPMIMLLEVVGQCLHFMIKD